jgi:hypothetical protein
MARKRRLHTRYGKRRIPETSSKPRRNPPVLADLAEFIVPGFAAFATTRLLTRMAAVQIAKRSPTWAKHAGAIASVGSFVAAYYGAHRVKMLEKHHTPIVVGSAIAAIQSLIQLYIPKLGWIIADATPDLAEQSQQQKQLAVAPAPQAQRTIAAAKLQPVDDDPAWYTFDEKFDAGRYAADTGTAPPANPKVQDEEALLAELNLDEGSTQSMGIFSN